MQKASTVLLGAVADAETRPSSMSVNFSSSPSLLPSTNIDRFSFMYRCLSSTVGLFSFSTFIITNILVLLPLYTLILYLGVQKWRQRRSSRAASHSDVFTYHMVAIELMSIFASMLVFCGVLADLPLMMISGIFVVYISSSGQMYFHNLTCVDRYLAVVHPVAYLNLKSARGATIRNVATACPWLLCFAEAVYLLQSSSIQIFYFCILVFTVVIVSFCSFSVLWVLIRSAPGEGRGPRQMVDPSKLRAFYTILIILGVLLVTFGGSILITALHNVLQLQDNEWCGLWLSDVWVRVPSSLVLPLLFLQRAGKLRCWRNNPSGEGSD